MAKRFRGVAVLMIACLFSPAPKLYMGQTQPTASQGPSMARGIAQTQRALDSVSEMMKQNIGDGDAFLNKKAFGEIGDWAGANGYTNLQHDLEALQSADESTDAIQAGNYRVLVNDTLRSLVEGYGENPLPFSSMA